MVLDEVEDIRFQMGGNAEGRAIGFGSSRRREQVVGNSWEGSGQEVMVTLSSAKDF